MRDRLVTAALIVQKIPEIIVSPGVFGVVAQRGLERQHLLDSGGKTVIGNGLPARQIRLRGLCGIAGPFREPPVGVIKHGVAARVDQETFDQVLSVGEKPCFGVIECEVEAGLRGALEEIEEFAVHAVVEQNEFVPGLKIEWIEGQRPAREFGGFVRPAQMAQDARPEITRLQVIGVGPQRLVQMLQSCRKVTAGAVDSCQSITRGRLPRPVPCGFVE